jgi:hypothetical protein
MPVRLQTLQLKNPKLNVKKRVKSTDFHIALIRFHMFFDIQLKIFPVPVDRF